MNEYDRFVAKSVPLFSYQCMSSGAPIPKLSFDCQTLSVDRDICFDQILMIHGLRNYLVNLRNFATNKSVFFATTEVADFSDIFFVKYRETSLDWTSKNSNIRE